MINTLVTILIPCNNSIEGLKTTVESLIQQTKIRGTRVLVLDYGSNDGSIQFSGYASSKYFQILKIESINLKDKSPEFSIFTPYCFCISPGVILKNPDFLIEAINSISTGSKDLVYYTSKTSNPIISFFPNYFKNKNMIEISGVICKREKLYLIKNEIEREYPQFSLSDKFSKSSYKMTKAKKENKNITIFA